MNIGIWLERQASRAPVAPAVFHGETLVADYAGFHRKAGQVAAELIRRGIGPGDRVALFLKNGPDYLITLYGIWYAGAAAVPINAKLHGREAAWIVQDSGASLVFSGMEQAEALNEAEPTATVVDVAEAEFAQMFGQDPLARPVPRDPGDLAWLFYTSGTTGRPKGVMITHGMLQVVSLSYLADVDAVRAEHATLYAAPMSHGAGIYAPVHVLKGARHICPRSGQFEPDEIFRLARRFGDVHLFAAPTMVKRMTRVAKEKAEDGQGLRTIVYAGGPMYNADIIEAVEQFGPVFVQIYGQGECPMAITALSRADVSDRNHARWQARLGSVGRAQSAVEVQIGDEQGQPLPPGQHGEVMVRGTAVMPGYWQNPEATAKTLVNGWLMTGDVGELDEDGYLTLMDRSKDLIISGGSNIYPREVEEVLLQHPDVREVSVVGRDSAEWGEDVVAFVVPEAGHEMNSPGLDAHCVAHIARFKRPKAYYELSELPKNNYGKVLKTELRKILQGKDS